MLDIFDFIKEKGGNPDKIKESQRRRWAPEEAVDQVIELYEDHRKTQYAATQINTKINETQKQIGVKRKAKEDATDLMAQKVDLEKEKKALTDSATEKELVLKKKIGTIGNIVHDSVPISDNEDNNTLQREWAPEGLKVEKRDVLSHHEVLTRLDGYDPERGVKVVGHRGYFLKKWGVFLNQALINYGLEFLDSKGYTPLQTPQFMLKEYMAKTAQLEQFDEELYKVVDGDAQNDKYLIATSEQPISAFHADEWLVAKDLPIKYAGFSSCYRREAGSHGRDAWGIFRVHQFEKVEDSVTGIEQFVLTDPEKSWEMFDDMIAFSEEFYKSLGVPYRVVAIVSGALNNAAAKKYDLEAWFPFQGEYKELVSCSNCTDYQSRALEIRYGAKLQTEIRKKYVHALNSTLCATERALCCLLENFQTEEGFNVPEPLRKYLPGTPEFLPFTKELPKDTTSQKVKGKASKEAPKPKIAPGGTTPEAATGQLKDLKV
ncbi:seryl-tRNA synthetase [Diplocarpon rosae]|nr:seryl-tRNA synthetase [Diplocarpon rosae]